MNSSEGFRLGEWQVEPAANRLTGPDGAVSINTRSMDVLCCLAEHAGEVVSRDDFAGAVWQERVVTDDALTWCISELRRKLGDSAASPRYIETIPKRGYRLIAPVERSDSHDRAEPPVRFRRRANRWRRAGWLWAGIAGLGLAAWLSLDSGQSPPVSIQSPAGMAVLPLTNITNPDSGFPLAEGLHQDLLTRLSGIPALRVISATSMRRYRQTDKSIPEIAAELDVEWVVEGTVQQWDERFRVSVQLIDAARDSHRWARNYEGELTAARLFEAQAEIIDDIAESVEAALAPEPPLVRLPTQSLEAYALTVRANTLLRQRSESTMRQAGSLYQRATELDPEYAAAWARRGETLFLLHYYGHETEDVSLIEARQMAQRALSLDPELAFAMLVEGLVAMRLEHDLPKALSLVHSAWERQPGAAVGWLAWMEAVGGNLPRGLELTRRQIQSTPFSPGVHYSLGILTLCAGDVDEALALAERALELSPAYVASWSLKGQALLLQGRVGPAANAFEEALTLSGRRAEALDLAWLALARSRAGDPIESLAADVMASEDGLAKALINLALDKPEAAVDSLRQPEWDDMGSLVVRYHPILEPLRSLDEFGSVVERIEVQLGMSGVD